MPDSVMHPSEFHKLIGTVMKEKYAYEQRVADKDLTLHRQHSERSRSASRTPDRRRSLSNTSLGSRVANQRNRSVQPSGRPPHAPLRGQTPIPVAENFSGEVNEHNSTALIYVPKQSILANINDESPRVEVLEQELSAHSVLLNSAHRINEEHVVNTHECNSEQLEKDDFGGFTPSPKRSSAIKRSAPDNEGNEIFPFHNMYRSRLQILQPQGACSRCVELEAKVQCMQEALDKLTGDFVILAARQAADESLMIKDSVVSEIPDDPQELGDTTEERFLTVVTSLAKRVRRLEVDLEASLEQVRVMETAAIARDKRLSETKVGLKEIREIVARELQGARFDSPNEVVNLYRAWNLDPKSVREALDSSNPTACMNLILATPPFARLLRIVMDSNSDILNVLHEQQLRSKLEQYASSNHLASPMRHSDSSTTAVKNPVPLHELLLGIYLQDEKEVQGVRVTSVPMGSPAAHIVGPGDVIVQVNRVTVRSVADVSYVLSRARSRAPITLSIQVTDGPHVEVVQVLPIEIL